MENCIQNSLLVWPGDRIRHERQIWRVKGKEKYIIFCRQWCSEAMASSPHYSIFYLVAAFHNLCRSLPTLPWKTLGVLLPKTCLIFLLQCSIFPLWYSSLTLPASAYLCVFMDALIPRPAPSYHPLQDTCSGSVSMNSKPRMTICSWRTPLRVNLNSLSPSVPPNIQKSKTLDFCCNLINRDLWLFLLKDLDA